MLDVERAYVDHADAIRRYLFRLGGGVLSVDDVDDLVADTFVLAVRAAHRYEDRGHSTASWLYRIAHNVWASDRRRRRPALRLDDLDLPHGDSSGAVDRQVDVRALLEQVTPRQRDALLARYFEDLAGREGAQRLGCSPDRYKKLLARGLRHLRTTLEAA